MLKEETNRMVNVYEDVALDFFQDPRFVTAGGCRDIAALDWAGMQG